MTRQGRIDAPGRTAPHHYARHRAKGDFSARSGPGHECCLSVAKAVAISVSAVSKAIRGAVDHGGIEGRASSSRMLISQERPRSSHYELALQIPDVNFGHVFVFADEGDFRITLHPSNVVYTHYQ